MNQNTLKIVNINASPHSSIGNTHILTKMFIERLQETNLICTLQVQYYYLSKMNIIECRGCITCMRKGNCILDSKDDVLNIISQLKSADLIIFSSPVYVSNISSLLKKFFERSAYITHRLELSNKLGISVITSQSPKVSHVSDYISKVMESMGILMLGNIEGRAFFHGKFENLDLVNKRINKIIYKLDKAIKSPHIIKTSKSEIKRRKMFLNVMKNKSVSNKLFKSDRKYWLKPKDTNEKISKDL